MIDQHTKKIMEECKVRAQEAGLKFEKETLEYIVTNKDMIELSPKMMIPTLYDYWVNDVEVLKKQGAYKLYPSNPYETVINSRPAISFYNDNNPDWLNIMIFYHVLGHIDFFQNNVLFEKTWDYDFVGQALADKRLIENLRSEYGRWVDYVIEFSRCIDNITGYFNELSIHSFPKEINPSERIAYYFDVFLQEIVKLPLHEMYKEVERFNELIQQNKDVGESMFFSEIKTKYPEFQAKFEKYIQKQEEKPVDLMEFIRDNSSFLKKENNNWMKSVMNIVRNTALYVQPQIRTKIINEGWASYWHDKLFRTDKRIAGFESSYARINAGVTSINRIGLNPYAIGLRLIQYIEEMANKGKMSFEFQQIYDIEKRKSYNKNTGSGIDAIFELRKKFSDFTLINTFVTQDFVDRYDLFVTGKRLDPARGIYVYYIKSRKAEDYKKMLLDSLYHPPKIEVVEGKTTEDNLYISHRFENKQLIQEFIGDTLVGTGYLWGGQVQLETTEIIRKKPAAGAKKTEYQYHRVLYTIKDRKITKKNL